MASSALRARLAEIQARVPRGIVFGLERVTAALAELGNPQDAIACVHVAGTNGKGSTSAMVESIARAAGLRTGLYTSPHLCRFAERIRIDGEPIDDEAFARVLERVLHGCRADLTVFESLTIAAFVAFREAGVDLAVIEVGLGGRLDATNVIQRPLCTAITSIGVDHTEYLGGTIAAIAREKAGIAKAGVPLVLGPLDAEAERAIVEVAERVGAGPIGKVGRDIPVSNRALGLPGPHQAENAAVAAGIALHLAERFPGVSAAVERGLADARWPGRMERIDRGGVTVLLDCAHNPHGVAALAEALRRDHLDPARTALVFGALADKPWRAMLGQLAPFAARRYYAEPKGRAPAPLAELSAIAAGELVAEPRAAALRAIAASTPGDTVIVAGSIYLVGEVRAELLGIEADPVVAM